MITITLRNLINSTPGLNLLLEEDIPIKISLLLAKIIYKCEEHLKPYNIAKLALQKKYLSGDETLTPENQELAEKEHEELLAEEVDIDCELIPIESVENLRIKTKIILPLIWMFKE